MAEDLWIPVVDFPALFEGLGITEHPPEDCRLADSRRSQ
jgi:hypothetical protein